MFNVETSHYKSPIGIIEVKGSEKGIHSVVFVDDILESELNLTAFYIETQNCIAQLDEYFKGTRTAFELILSLKGTTFQQRVWKALLDVPFGKTRSYLEQSKIFGDVKAIRAVATANGKNPIWIIIPCHRIIGSDGSLTGYAGGLWRKKWLLEHEGVLNKQTSLF